MNKLFLVIIVLFGLGVGAFLASILPADPPLPNLSRPVPAENTPAVSPAPAVSATPPALPMIESSSTVTPPAVSGQNLTGNKLTPEEALKIAQASICLQEGSLSGQQFHNDQTKTWWLDLNPKQPRAGCSPACVVYDVTRTAEINWRCTGALPPR